MIKFKAKRVTVSGYSYHIPGNGGDNEMIITMSWGEDRKTRLVIVAADRDGGVTVLHAGKGRVTSAQMITTVGNTMRKWVRTGVKPDAEQAVWLEKQIDKVLIRLDPVHTNTDYSKKGKDSDGFLQRAS